jgi:lipoprotein-anchoring transpeptidase ErfK/SrfK
MPYAMFFSGGRAVHYSADFRARGYNGSSHGCVNMRDRKKIAYIFSKVKIGDRVLVYSA